MYCDKCGYAVRLSDTICTKCGGSNFITLDKIIEMLVASARQHEKVIGELKLAAPVAVYNNPR